MSDEQPTTPEAMQAFATDLGEAITQTQSSFAGAPGSAVFPPYWCKDCGNGYGSAGRCTDCGGEIQANLKPMHELPATMPFTPTHISDCDEPVEIVMPVQRLAGMVCVRRADGFEWFTRRLVALPPNRSGSPSGGGRMRTHIKMDMEAGTIQVKETRRRKPPIRVQPVVRRFRVCCEMIIPDPRVRNPFLVRDWYGVESKVLIRTWEMDASSETEVRRLFDEAKGAGEPQVQGMRIRSIEEIAPNISYKP